MDERVDDIELRMNTQGKGGLPVDRMDPQEKIYRQAFAQYALKGPDALSGEIRNALSVGSNLDGGFWVPSTISEQVIQKLYETSPMRKIANIQTIETDELEEPIDNDEADSGWVGETESRSDKDSPEIGLQKIPLHEQ